MSNDHVAEPFRSILNRVAGRRACRRCSDCEGSEHHWMPDVDDETDEPVMVCKHCEATREMTDEDFDE